MLCVSCFVHILWMVYLLNFDRVICVETVQIDDKLLFAQIIARHGDRTIPHPYANDPYKNKTFWKEGFGQLTNRGKQRQYELGQFLNRRYGQFLGPYSPEKISILSSDYDRTIASAMIVLAALFPPNEDQIWNENLLWQAIPVHSIPRKWDYLINAEISCPRYIQLYEEYENSPEMKSLFKEHRELFQYLEENAGQPMHTLENLKSIHGVLYVERSNKTLPEWAEKLFVSDSKFEYLALYWIKTITATTEMKRLKSGFLLKEILDRFKDKSQSLLPDQLMYIYSGHDITIGSMLNTLGLFEIHLPPYSSSLIFELYKSNDSHYIQLFYRTTETDDLMPLNIPNCGTKCDLSKFYELYNDVLPLDFNRECLQ